MKYLFMIFVVSVFLVFSLQAQDRFDRIATIQADTLDVGGYAKIVVDVDLDNDGNPEIYAINNDWYDVLGKDLIPRIYKYEKNSAGEWNTVWSTRLPLDFQNSWGALTSADLDQDGRGEIIWSPVNNDGGGLQVNPERIAVFETPADGTDNMGVDNLDGTWRPNAQWTIDTVGTVFVNQRPFLWIVKDYDNDGTDEIIAACRAGDNFQIYSVNDVPDAADSTETWSLEYTTTFNETVYDMVTIDNSYYLIDNDGDVFTLRWVTPGDSFQVFPAQDDIAGLGSWAAAQVVDVDGDMVEEIIVASWSTSQNNVYLLQESGDSLVSTMIKDVPSTSGRLYGGDVGDLDGDGNLDYVFGTRDSSPLGIIHRLEYQGGSITDPNNWELSVMDQGSSAQTLFDIVAMANLDSDAEDEVVYSGTPRGLTADDPKELVILDRIPDNQPIINTVLDVPNDQGRQVWVIWQAAADDTMPSPAPFGGTIPVAIFGGEETDFPEISINGRLLQPVKVGEENQQNMAQFSITQYVVWRIDAGQYPVQVASVVPIQASYYAAVVPTLGDDEEATFVVSAHTSNVQVNWKSFPKTGVSVDNLVPTAPTNLAGTQMAANVELTWDESPDTDFNYFSIRRGDQPGFDPNIGTEVGTTTDPFFTDLNVQTGNWFYRVVAFDFNGNEGEFSDEVSVPMGLEGTDGTIPREFALHQNYPNPFNPETWISFDLPKSVDVSITIYNTLGQKVRTLVSEAAPAGSYKVLWDGTNQNSVRVASGIYIYTIRAGTFVQSRKMTFMK